jgi:UDP-glucose 4-epimerase
MKFLARTGTSAAFNLGNERGFSVREVLEIAEVVTGKSIEVKIADRRPGDPAELFAAADLARSELGWKPAHPELTTMIETAWQWARILNN